MAADRVRLAVTVQACNGSRSVRKTSVPTVPAANKRNLSNRTHVRVFVLVNNFANIRHRNKAVAILVVCFTMCKPT